jgi:hypothetical protein
MISDEVEYPGDPEYEKHGASLPGWTHVKTVQNGSPDQRVGVDPPTDAGWMAIEFLSKDCSGGFLGTAVYHDVLELEAWAQVGETQDPDAPAPSCATGGL